VSPRERGRERERHRGWVPCVRCRGFRDVGDWVRRGIEGVGESYILRVLNGPLLCCFVLEHQW
jgi:hypothetical protein